MGTWKTLLLFWSCAQGIVLSAALIIVGVRKYRSNIFLGLLLLVCSVEILNVWAISFDYHGRPDAIPFWLAGSYLLLPAALWVFIQYTTVPGFVFRKTQGLFFLPALLEIVTETIVFYYVRATGSGIRLSQHPLWAFYTETLPVVLMCIVIGYYAWRLQIAKQIFNAKEQQQGFLFKQYLFFSVFAVLTVLWVFDSLFGLPVFPLTAFLLCGVLFLFGYINFFQPSFYQYQLPAAKRTVEPGFSGYDAARETIRLKQLLKTEKLFCQPRLSVEDLAVRLNLPARYLSYLINQHLDSNFSFFINSYRVQEVIRRMQDPAEQNKTLLGIALDCGFNSKSSFNQIFKQHTGETPSTCLSKLKNKAKNRIPDV